MGRTVVRVGAVLVVCWLALVAGASAGWAFGSVRPVPGPVVRGYDPPEPNWLAGHRGVDLGASVGSEVRVAAPGRVSVAQVIAGRGVVTVVHGELRTSYEPVKATVRVGDQVQAGDVIGLLEAGHCPAGCLHFGLKRGAEYLDPLGDSEVRLLPESAVALARRLAAERAAASGGTEPPGSGVLLNPVGGRISSPFGRRFHPILHYWRMHNGNDWGASCGQPLRAARSGKVLIAGRNGGYGNFVLIGHGDVNGRYVTTGYGHMSSIAVRAGQYVSTGEYIGAVGSTGLSTECHLHLELRLDGNPVNPMRYIP